MLMSRQVRLWVYFSLCAFCILSLFPLEVFASSTKEAVEGLLDDLALPLGGILSTWVSPPDDVGRFSIGISGTGCPVGYEDPFDQEKKTFFVGLPAIKGRLRMTERVGFGIKYGYLPRFGILKEGPTLLGGQFNLNILKEGIATPFLWLRITQDGLSGIRLEGEDWKVTLSGSAFSLKIILGKRFPFIHPYGGLGYDWCNLKAGYEIPSIKEEWIFDSSFLRTVLGCEFAIFPFTRLTGEYNRIRDRNIYGFGLRIGF